MKAQIKLLSMTKSVGFSAIDFNLVPLCLPDDENRVKP